MTNVDKIYWSPQELYAYLEEQNNSKKTFSLPNNVYCTENFTWNEILKTRDKFFQMPTLEILENLNTLIHVLQQYRTTLGKEIDIVSSWRTSAEQNDLLIKYQKEKTIWLKEHKGNPPNIPSTTSLHLEGLAIDVSVKDGSHKDLQKLVNETFAGEAEFGWNYTHIGLTTFSKSYLQRHGLFREDIYRKLVLDTTKLPKMQRDAIEKRINPANWNIRYSSTFSPIKNAEFFKNSSIGST